MTHTSLRADCARCAALCCVAFAFEASELFGRDKAAAEPCVHLTGCGRCAIHATRREHGYGGCVGYDCLGAGQWVTQVLFAGRNWRADPKLLGPMAAAFFTVQRAHELLLLLDEAGRLPLTVAKHRRLGVLIAAIEDRRASWESVSALTREAESFLRSLRRHAPPR